MQAPSGLGCWATDSGGGGNGVVGPAVVVAATSSSCGLAFDDSATGDSNADDSNGDSTGVCGVVCDDGVTSKTGDGFEPETFDPAAPQSPAGSTNSVSGTFTST